MATCPLSLLLRRRRTVLSPFLRHLSSLPLPSNPNTDSSSRSESSSDSKPPSLSSRLSFVFDQLDSLNRTPDLSAQDAALRQIRSWRQPNTKQEENSEKEESFDLPTESSSMNEVLKKEVELVHPWPEWIELMEQLAKQRYFEVRRSEEDEQHIADNVSIDLKEVEEGNELNFWRDWQTVKNASLNFGRDRFDIIRKLQRKDIETLLMHGCPSMDMRVVFSSKLLRKLVHLDEGDVCSSCNLRNSCTRGYILTPKEDEARTLDIIRVLLIFGFDHINGSVENKDLMKIKAVKNVARKLMHEIVRLSAVPIDPNLSPPVIKKPPLKVKQPQPPPRKKRIGRDDVEMKKGDWLCPKCDFMNFAKNTVCMQCDAKRPKRILLPGEWECPRCKFLNYRRNMSCYECEHKRPPDEYTSNQAEFHETGQPHARSQPTRLPEVSDAWNFDFDDNESDGADVAAFEFADSSKKGFENDHDYNARERGPGLREIKPDPITRETGRTGFDDFDDDEEDDLDNYEIMRGGNGNDVERKSFSDLEVGSDPDENNEFDRNKNPNPNPKRDYYSDNDEENDEIIKRSSSGRVHNNNNNNNNKRGGKRMDSEDEFDSEDDFSDGFKPNRGRRVPLNDLDSDGDEEFPSTRNNKSKGRKFGSRESNNRSRSYNDVVSDPEEESWDRGRGKFGNNGGFRGQKDDSFGDNGGFRGRKDDRFSDNGGFRGRKDDRFGDGGGGFRGRKDDRFGDGGGFRGRKDDRFGDGGGFRGRKDDRFGDGGGFRGRKDDSFGNDGGFKGRKDDRFGDNGGFRGARRNERGRTGGDEGFERERSSNGGFRGAKRNERGRGNGDEGFERGRSNNGGRGGFGDRKGGGNGKGFGRDRFGDFGNSGSDERPRRRANSR